MPEEYVAETSSLSESVHRIVIQYLPLVSPQISLFPALI